MQEIEKRIFVSEEIMLNEYAYMYGDLKGRHVTFTYLNTITSKETDIKFFTYKVALKLARRRVRDGRYKNYEFVISE